MSILSTIRRGIGGMLTGGLGGAAIGSAFGPVGTGVGALLGGLTGGMFGGGTPSKIENVQKYTPQQQAAMNTLLTQGLHNMDPKALEEMYVKQFNEQTVPQLAEQFTAIGGGQRSGNFQAALARAGSDLNARLAALRSQRGLQSVQLGLQPQFEPIYMKGQPGIEGEGGENLGAMLQLFSKGGLNFKGGQQNNQSQSSVSGQYASGQPQGFSGSSLFPSWLKSVLGKVGI